MVILGFIGGVFVGATFGLLAAGLAMAAKEGDRVEVEMTDYPGKPYAYPGPRCVR